MTSLNSICTKVVSMASDREAKKLVENQGLAIQTVSWEDTARNKGSCWGPNISDMTLQVNGHKLPVIRHPNFTDLTWDVAIDKIAVAVGNEKGSEQLQQITLKEYLKDVRNYLHDKSSWKGSNNSLYSATKDSHVLMSAQSCFLPITEGDESKFNVCLYNYQSTKANPRVLCIVATANGTSAQVITNDGNGGYASGQKLYFNKNGSKTSFLAQRLKDNRRERGVALEGEMTAEEKSQNMIVVIQVPLKAKQAPRPQFQPYSQPYYQPQPYGICGGMGGMPNYANYGGMSMQQQQQQQQQQSFASFGASQNYSSMQMNNSYGAPQMSAPPSNCYAQSANYNSPPPPSQVQNLSNCAFDYNQQSVSNLHIPKNKKEECNVEAAIIKVGESEGVFTEFANLDIERDEAYPIRVTLQYYHGTSNGVINQTIVDTVAKQLTAAKTHADFLGSLVVNPKGDRPTERSDLPSTTTLYVPPWWTNFWLMYKANFPSLTEEDAKKQLFSTNHFATKTMQESESAVLQKLANGKLDPKPVSNFMTGFC